MRIVVQMRPDLDMYKVDSLTETETETEVETVMSGTTKRVVDG